MGIDIIGTEPINFMLTQLKPETIIDLIHQGELQLAKNRQGQYLLRRKSLGLEENIARKMQAVGQLRIHPLLLHEEIAIPKMNIQQWLKKLEPAMKHFNLETLENFAVALNQLALILMHVNQPARAEKLCLDAIIFYEKLSQTPGKEELILHVLQPFINLVRIQRITRKYETFQKWLPALNTKASETDWLNSFSLAPIIKQAVALTPDFPTYKNLLELNFLIESVKYALSVKDYMAIVFHYEKNFSAGETDFFSNYAAEAACLAYQLLGKFDRAYQIAMRYFHQGMIEHMEIFSYRKAEIFRNTGEKSHYQEECKKLSSYCLGLIEAGIKNLNQLALCQVVANLVEDENKDLSVFINQHGYQAAMALEDEMGSLQILEKLLTQVPSMQWQNDYHQLRRKTDYLRFKTAGSGFNSETLVSLEQVLYQCNRILHAAG